MFAKTIKFKDFFDNERSEVYYFNLSESEILSAQFDASDDFRALIQGIANTRDVDSLGKLFREIILRSYGVPSSDGLSFEKSEEIRNKFERTAAYNTLYTELLFDDKAASEFINKVIPIDKLNEIIDKANERAGKAPLTAPALTPVQ